MLSVEAKAAGAGAKATGAKAAGAKAAGAKAAGVTGLGAGGASAEIPELFVEEGRHMRRIRDESGDLPTIKMYAIVRRVLGWARSMWCLENYPNKNSTATRNKHNQTNS